MDGNCHFIFGAAWGSMIALNLDKIANTIPQINDTPETALLFVFGGLIGGIFPDIDSPKSYMGKLSSPLSDIIGNISGWFGKTGMHHRGILHDPIVYIGGLVFSYLFFPPLIGFFIGCFSHLFLDAFNPAGIPVFFNSFRIRFAGIKSGSTSSILVTWVFMLVTVFFGISSKLFF